MPSKIFPEFDDRKHTITVDKVPEWMDATCYIEERKGKTYAVSRTRVRRWKVWRDWWRANPLAASLIQTLLIISSGSLAMWPMTEVIMRAGVRWTVFLFAVTLVWGFIAGWMIKGGSR